MNEKTKNRLGMFAVILSAAGLFSFAGTMIYQIETGLYDYHDVTVRLHYLDGSTQVVRYDSIPVSYPYLHSYHGSYGIMFPNGSIPAVCRYELLSEQRYQLTNEERMNIRNN